MAGRLLCTIPILLLSTQADHLAKTAAEMLVRGGYPNVHTAIRIPSGSHVSLHVSSYTLLPPADEDHDTTLDALLAFFRKLRTAALLPVRTEDALFVAQRRTALTETHPVPVPEYDLLRAVCTKLTFTRLAESLNLPVPRTVACEPNLDADAIAEQLKLPLFAKPVIGESGTGIRRLHSATALRAFIKTKVAPAGQFLFQEEVPGEDVARTLPADQGDVFAVAIRKRWFRRPNTPPFSPICDVEFICTEWLEELGRSFVRATQFSGIADFDLKVDFEHRQAWFLQCDPRLMGTMRSMALFGVNVPKLPADRALGRLPAGYCARTETGYALSLRSVPAWLASGAWQQPHRGPLRLISCNLCNILGAASHRIRTKLASHQ